MSTGLGARLCYFIATGLGSGRGPKSPGTLGSLAALAVWYGMTRAGLLESLTAQIGAAAALFVAGILATGVVLRKEALAGRAAEDPQFVVIDEWAGMAIALLGANPHSMAPLAAFALFRFFDITKIPPATRFEALPGAWGVMMDDIAAGIWARAALALCMLYAPKII